MAEQKYTPLRGLLGWLTGFDPNNPTAPRKPALSPASTNGRGGANRPPAKTGDGTQQSAQRTGMPVSPTKSGPVIGGRGGGGAIGRMPLSPTKSGPVAGGRGGGGAAGRMTTQKAAPAVATRKPAPKPMSTMDKVRADKGLMDTIRTDAAALRKPAQKTAPKQSWWDKFSEDHKLSAAKSYADYKKLMESM